MPTMNKTRLTPMRAIRMKCLDCCCDQVKEVRLCPCTDCSLYPYRLGHRPKAEAEAEEIEEPDEEEEML